MKRKMRDYNILIHLFIHKYIYTIILDNFLNFIFNCKSKHFYYFIVLYLVSLYLITYCQILPLYFSSYRYIFICKKKKKLNLFFFLIYENLTYKLEIPSLQLFNICFYVFEYFCKTFCIYWRQIMFTYLYNQPLLLYYHIIIYS